MSITGGAATDGQGFFYPPTILAVRPMPPRLGNQLGIFCQRAHAINDMSVFHQNNLMEVFLMMGNGFSASTLSRSPSAIAHRRRGFLDRRGNTRNQSAAADRDDDRINVG